MYKVINDNCLYALNNRVISERIDLTFLDPPFNQNKEYAYHQDNMDEDEYWKMMTNVCDAVYQISNHGAAIYFMQREKNSEFVLGCLRRTGWKLQNLIIWKKKTSAVPVANKYGKQYQIIAYATKGEKAKTFHRLRIDPPLPVNYKQKRKNGVFVTDVWEDIRELTSGYFAGDEAIRSKNGERIHKQQSPIGLLLRIVLTSTEAGDWVLDPFAGTGTTLCVAEQLKRNSIGIEIDPNNVQLIVKRLANLRESDSIQKYYKDYIHTENLAAIWGINFEFSSTMRIPKELPLFEL